MTQTWLWIGVIGMALGSAFFGLGAHNAKKERWRILFTLNFFICFIAAGLYLSMALGQRSSGGNLQKNVDCVKVKQLLMVVRLSGLGTLLGFCQHRY